MIKYYLSMILLLCLLGCQNSNGSKHYLTQKPVIPPDNLTGLWSGATNHSLATLKINNDGTAIICYSNVHHKTNLVWAKFDGNNFILQNGRLWHIINWNDSALNITEHNIRWPTPLISLAKDDHNQRITVACSQRLQLMWMENHDQQKPPVDRKN